MKSAITLSLVSEAIGGPFVFWHDTLAAARHAMDLGFDAMEIFAPDAQSVLDLKWQSIAPNLPIAALGTGAGWVKHRLLLTSPEASERKKAIEFVRSFLEVGGELGAKVIIGSMQGRSNNGLNRTEALKHLRSSLEELDRYSSQYGSELLYEPLNRYETDLCNTIECGSQLIEGLTSTKLLADLFHMNLEEASVEDSLRDFRDQIGHIHFADSNRHAIGFGHIVIGKIMETLQAVNYRGYLSAEILPLPNALEAARKTIESFRKYSQP